MHDITLYLPFPPSINDYYGNRGHVKYVKKKGKEFRNTLREEIRQQLLGELEPLSQPLKVTVTLYMPDRRRRDLDNYMKALLDACSPDEKECWPGIWEDDSLIDQLLIYRGEVVRNKTEKGMVLMEIESAWPVELAVV
jgi:crossover junction endodeoxyribonuclease RusA